MKYNTRRDFLTIAGGCCVTTPDHVAEIARKVGAYKPRCLHDGMFTQLMAA